MQTTQSIETLRAKANILVQLANLLQTQLMEARHYESRLKPAALTANQLITDLRTYLLATEAE